MVENAQILAAELKDLAYFLPLVWVSFIIIEYIEHRKYYRALNILHSYNMDYTNFFNPRYLVSLINTIGILIIVYIIIKVVPFYIIIGFFIAALAMIVLFVVRRNRIGKTLYILRGTIYKKYDIKYQYQKAFSKWIFADNVIKLSSVFFLICALEAMLFKIDFKSGFFIPSWFYILPEEITKIVLDIKDGFNALANDFNNVMNEHKEFQLLAYVALIIISATTVHWKLYYSNSPYIAQHGHHQCFRVFVDNGKMYVILAPTYYEKRDICIAVRTIVCRNINGLEFGYLVQDDIMTQKSPFVGDTIKLNVDVVFPVSERIKQPSLLSDKELIALLKRKQAVEYLSNDNVWEPVSRFNSSNEKKEKTIILT